MSQIDETQPGSGVDDNVSEQLTDGDTLGRGADESLDEGYSPPDREPAVQVPTPSEEAAGESLDRLLSAEVPDVWAQDEANLFDEAGDEVGASRAGRLVGVDNEGITEVDDELLAGDVGIDGAGASAEEAAVHVIDEYDQR